MNLHMVVADAIGAVNPNQRALVQPSAGYTTRPNGDRVPAYGPTVEARAQVQALTELDLRQLDSLAIAGSTHTLYMTGALDSLVRAQNKGGDLVTLADGGRFLVTAVLEQWPDWVKAAVTLQRA